VEKTVIECSAESIFERLVTEMLHGIQLAPNDFDQKAIIIIDGLDEVTQDNRNVLSSFLVRHLPKTPDWLRVIILSRFEPPLPSDLQRYPRHEVA
jgi:hypothetical protein